MTSPNERLPGVHELLHGLPPSVPSYQFTYPTTASWQHPSPPHILMNSRPSSAGSFGSARWPAQIPLSSSPNMSLDHLALGDSQPTTPMIELSMSPITATSSFTAAEIQPDAKARSSPETTKSPSSSFSKPDKDGYYNVPAPGVTYTALNTLRVLPRWDPKTGKYRRGWDHKTTEKHRRGFGLEQKAAIYGPLKLTSEGAKRYKTRLSQTSHKSEKNDTNISVNQTGEVSALAINALLQMHLERGGTHEEVYERMSSEANVNAVIAFAAAARRANPWPVGSFPNTHPEDLESLIARGFVTRDAGEGARDVDADADDDADSERDAKRQSKVAARKQSQKKKNGPATRFRSKM